MRTRHIADIEVSCIGLGGMPLSIAGRPDAERGKEVIEAAVRGGMTLIDTADAYCLDNDDFNHNERLIAAALAELGDDGARVTVATKGGVRRPSGAWTRDARPDRLREACEASLKALDREVIDLYQLHAPDPEVPLADSVGALARLREEGKIRLVGLSNVSIDEIEEARAIVPVASVQNRCNLWDADPLSDGIIDHCAANEIAFIPHSPVGGHRGHARSDTDDRLQEVATSLDASPQQVMLAWLLAVAPVVIPIPGASRLESVRSSIGAAELELPEEVVAELTQGAREGA